MLALLAAVVCATQPGVGISVGTRASTVQVSPVGKASPNGLPPSLDSIISTDVMSPRVGQRGSNESSQFTLDATLGEALTLELKSPDELVKKIGEEDEVTLYGRVRIGKVWLHEALLKAGWAWVLPSARKDLGLVKLEDEARAAKRGLWAEADPVEPWVWHELLLLRDVEGKLVHSGWDCPQVKQTQCARCGGGRFSGLEEAKAAGFTPHEVCMTPELIRIAAASGEREAHPGELPQSPRRACTKDSECALTLTAPCTCPGCGGVWREAARKEVAARMKVNFARATCGGVGCPACAGRSLGTRAVCREKQCAPDGPRDDE